jgi:DNA-binding HxlR family transcriptional regulator
MAILSMRLKTLEKEESSRKRITKHSSGIVRWTLTEKGEDALPILIRPIAFGSKWYAKEVFEDEVLRSLNEVFARP